MLLAYGASQLSPAWAMRYLAVAVPPFLLLVAAGLAASRGLGVLGLVIVSILWAYDVWPTSKSNVRAVAAAVGPSLSPGDVVVSTQPEQIPVLHHYLPPGLRYATLTGYVKDVGVTDWRDGVERLEATLARSATSSRSSTRSRRAAGSSWSTPIIFDMARWRAPWTKLVRLRSEEFDQYLTNDARFQTTAIYPPYPRKEGPNPVAATVLLKTR